ncbi:MAG: polysaccharide deacetylase family protein [Acidobacteria bacterium]|nr:polysaccharide deacetylase family protein [Acidobacteriota bacterium]
MLVVVPRRVVVLAVVLCGVIAGAWPSAQGAPDSIGHTIIAPWQHGRSGAVSVTYDDASINQFRVAARLMTERRLPGTFFVLTGAVRGSKYPPRFIGRPPADILRESAAVPTSAGNFRERIAAAPFLGFSGLIGLRTSAAPATPQTFARVDDAYRRARAGEWAPLPSSASIFMDNGGIVIQEPPRPDVEHATWDDIRRHAAAGHEIGSHTITHPRLDALDEPNIRYELEQSRLEIEEQLGERHTFSAEAPFGIEDERVMEIAHGIYPALRNRMPHEWLDELNRSSQRDPLASTRPYVQWQRGILARTTSAQMQSWIDTTRASGRTWLVIVIHGVEGIGWEPVTRAGLSTFFDALVASQDDLWVATFQDVTKYLRERMSATVTSSESKGTIQVTLTHALDRSLYDLPLTLRTRVPGTWTRVRIEQGKSVTTTLVTHGVDGAIATYQAAPNGAPVLLMAD